MELLTAIGLILPAVTGVAVFLTPLAATGLVVMMLLAVLTLISFPVSVSTGGR